MIACKCVTEEPIRAGEVQFGILSADDVRNLSISEISDTTIYYRGLPNPHGINDHRMGTVDRRLLCGTCSKDVRDCQGHTGNIELSFPMYHIGFFDTTLKVLKCVCYACSRLCIGDEDLSNIDTSTYGKNTFNTIFSMIKLKRKCPHCGFIQPQYTRQALQIKVEWNPDTNWQSPEEKEFCMAPFTQRDVLSILSNISDDDCAKMGFNITHCHPKNTVLQNICVPPPVARPAIMASEGSRSRGQDDLTHKLQDINKRSIDLKNMMGDSHFTDIDLTPDLIDKINKLQFDVFTYMNNSIRGQKQSTQRSGQPTKSITDRLKGKDGRIRGNLMGKRVDFSARSVITPDAMMDVDEVGIPIKIAMCLTVPERVTSENIEALTKRVQHGSNHVSGAATVITNTGVMISLSHCESREKIRLQYGWIVERFLQDEDVVIFNRQPSLHKMGMMGHRVKLMQGLTFRLNLCCANPYNADFDGDEMNLHVPQSSSAIADVATLMMVGRQIISPQANKPVMGIVQDSLLGAHLMSLNNVFIDKKMACHFIASVKYSPKRLPPPCVCHPNELWSGKQLLSLLFPKDFMIGGISNATDLSDNTQLLVQNGNILCGSMAKSNMGTSAGGIVDVMFRDYGSVITVRWMSDVQRLANSWLMNRGFAVGVKDCILSEKGEARVAERIDKAMKLADEIMMEKVLPNSREETILESTVMRILSKTLMQTGGIVDEELGKDNSIRAMVNAGSKGNPINLSQICGCVGQQSIEGGRVIPEKGGRTLSCFDFEDTTLACRGFVQNSYALGLHPHEYFFHAMGGREGLVDTAVKTATTGYIQRRQIKSMEDHKVFYDGTVRNADESIVDFRYGGDEFDASRLERYSLELLNMSDAKIHAVLTEWEANEAIVAKNELLACKHGELDTRVLIPFNPTRMKRFPQTTVIPAFDVVEETVQVFVDLQHLYAIKGTILYHFNTNALLKLRYSLEDINLLFRNIQRKIDSAYVHAGEMVGSIAAQSIGEPATQMTLNTFHLSGVGNKNVTQGIPRLKELLDQAKTIKTPCISVALKHPFCHNKEFATYFANTVPLTRLGDIVLDCQIIYEPVYNETSIDRDKRLVADDAVWNVPTQNASSFVSRMTLNQEYMKARYITPPIVRKLLRNRLNEKAYVTSSETNSVEWVIRVRFESVHEMMKNMNLNLEKEGLLCHRTISTLLDTLAICGHKDIKGATVRETGKEYVVDTHGGNFLDLSVAPCVDWYNTTSNNVTEIHECLGIEAAVSVLFTELKSTLSFDGTYVDPRHMMMIVNTMTRGGYIMPLSRHGLNRMDTGPLLRCTFEETPDILCDAACFGEHDNGKGVSQNIIAGRIAAIGSGLARIEMDMNCMHPRSLNIANNKKRNILKSNVRAYNTEAPVVTEFISYERNKHVAPDDTEMLPFEINESRHTPQIFSSSVLQVPYDETPSDKTMGRKTKATRAHYRPSSPDLS